MLVNAPFADVANPGQIRHPGIFVLLVVIAAVIAGPAPLTRTHRAPASRSAAGAYLGGAGDPSPCHHYDAHQRQSGYMYVAQRDGSSATSSRSSFLPVVFNFLFD